MTTYPHKLRDGRRCFILEFDNTEEYNSALEFIRSMRPQVPSEGVWTEILKDMELQLAEHFSDKYQSDSMSGIIFPEQIADWFSFLLCISIVNQETIAQDDELIASYKKLAQYNEEIIKNQDETISNQEEMIRLKDEQIHALEEELFV